MPEPDFPDTLRRMLAAADVRRKFVEFFESKGHTIVPSSPVVPLDDPTLLFTNAGMNQFKPLFLGSVDPSSPLAGLKRAADSQKCIRAGGKHNDLEDVGKDTYHHTFFEMLGNWSFGDYFKAEAIAWAWELLTEVYGVPGDRLYATYFGGDEEAGLQPDLEAKKLWERHLPADRVLPGGMKDNFWEMGDTGPCGPCSEIHFDKLEPAEGEAPRNASSLVNADDPNVIEVWNLVFIQYDRQADRSLKTLPAKHVDTGMGLERLSAILQGVDSNYDTDLFTPIFAAIERVTGAPRPYRGRLGAADEGNVDTAYRVIADHIRTLTFAIADGAVPSNEGRGYVLRRVLRRAVRYGRQMLGARTGFFCQLVPTVVETMGGFFPELKEKARFVTDVLREEEESFGRTLDRGIKLFEEEYGNALIEAIRARHPMAHIVRSAKGPADKGPDVTVELPDLPHPLLLCFSTVNAEDITDIVTDRVTLSGEAAFRLFDTSGFPLDLTQLMAEERGVFVDVDAYERCMEEQRQRSRAAMKEGKGAALELDADAIARLKYKRIEPTVDADKYHGRDIRATVKAVWTGRSFDEHVGPGVVGLILDRTNFYAEAGGQAPDHGRMMVMREAGGSPRHGADRTMLASNPVGGEFKVEDVQNFGGYIVHIGRLARGEVRVGDDVHLHIDSTRRAPIMANHTMTHAMNFALRKVLGGTVDQRGSAVGPDRLRFDFTHNAPTAPAQLAEVDAIVNEMIARDLPVHTGMAPLYLARNITGLRAVFGEKYPDPVRVVSIGTPVDSLLDKPDNPEWSDVPVEFCGGTHLSSTGQARAFAVVAEEAIAKGVRRVVALTGVPALAAIEAADGLAERIAAAANLSDEQLPGEVTAIAAEIDHLTMPTARKAELRERLAGLQERVKSAAKAVAQAKAREAASQAARIAESALRKGDKFIVETISVGSDRGALQSAVNTVAARCPKAAVMLLSPDEAAGKVSVMSAVPKALVSQGVDAGEWVSVSCGEMGGKGGGRPNAAQGAGADLSKLDRAIAAAQRWADRNIK